LDWSDVIDTALAHGVAGLLARALLALPEEHRPAGLSPDLAAALAVYLDVAASQSRSAVAALHDVLERLESAGIAALPFKGPALAALAYPTPADRESVDLDLLIRPDDAEAAIAVLAGLGYAPQYPNLPPARRRAYYRYNGQDLLMAADRVPLEPHWHFVPHTLAVDLDTAPLWQRACTVMLEGRAVRTLAAGDALLVACLNGGKEEWRCLRWIADVAFLLAPQCGVDPATELARARQAGLRRVLLIGVALARDVLGVPLDPAWITALAADRTAARLARQAAALLWTAGPAESVFRLSAFRWHMRERLGDRLRYAARTLLTARVPHYVAMPLPEPLAGLYPLVRLGHDFVALPLWRNWRRLRPS